MQIARDLAGFTGGEADTLRKAMGKKIAKLLAQMKEQFIEGAVKQDVNRGLATKLFGELEDFARYAFNKSHAACYALIAYQTAYLKAHYPSSFMAALMTSEQENLDKLAAAIAECEQMGIKVLPPDVNESFASFAVAGDKRSIRFGLDAIKNLGKNTVEAIIATRKADGPFKSLANFLSRLPEGTTNRKSLEALIKAGALDSLADRGHMLAGLEVIVRFAQTRAAEARSGQTSLFGGDSKEQPLVLPTHGTVDERQKLEWERELLGMYVSEHPLSSLDAVVSQFTPVKQLAGYTDGQRAEIACLVTGVKRITTRKGDPMAFATVEDKSGPIEVIVFPKLYMDKREQLEVGAILKVSGKISRKDSELKLLADTLTPLAEGDRPVRPAEPAAPASAPDQDLSIQDLDAAVAGDRPEAPKVAETSEEALSYEALTVRLGPSTTLATLESIKEVLAEHRGESPVYLIIQKPQGEQTLKLAHGIRYSKALIDALETVDWSVAVEVK